MRWWCLYGIIFLVALAARDALARGTGLSHSEAVPFAIMMAFALCFAAGWWFASHTGAVRWALVNVVVSLIAFALGIWIVGGLIAEARGRTGFSLSTQGEALLIKVTIILAVAGLIGWVVGRLTMKKR